MNVALLAEAQWISAHTPEAELIAQKKAGYSDRVRDQFIALKRQYLLHSVDDQAFLGEFQKAADWLVARKVLPEPVTVADHLAQL